MLWSKRFQKYIQLTRHVSERMAERSITEAMLTDLIDNGEIRYKDNRQLWIYKDFPHRTDNMICAAAVLEDMLVIKTVMIRWQLME